MSPIFLLVVVAAVAALGWRGVRRERDRVASSLKEAEAALRKRKPAAQESLTLERDPKTGVYRPPAGRD